MSSMEDSNLVPGDGLRRHADVTGHHCKMSHESYEKFGSDITVVHHDYMHNSSMRFCGVAATNAAKKKRAHLNTEINLSFMGIKFYPLAFEMDGSIGKAVSQFIKRVPMVANVRKKSNSKSFENWWNVVLACTLHHSVAETMLDKSRMILEAQTCVGLPYRIEKGAFQSMYAEKRMQSL